MVRALFLITVFLGIVGSSYSYSIAVSWKVSQRKQVDSNLQYVVLDIDRVVNNSIAYKKFKDRWAKINDRYQKEIEFYESQLLKLEKKATSKGVSEKDMIQVKQKIGVYEVKVQKLLRKRKEVLEKAGNKAIAILRENIDKLIYEYATQNNINIIFSKDQVVYFSNSINITSFILEKLNVNLRQLEVDI